MSHIPYPRPAGDFRTSYRADTGLFHSAGDRRFILAAAAFALTVPLWGDTYLISQLILIGIYAIAAIGLNVLVGNTGQISLGHGAFFGFGAFSSAYVSSTWGVPVMLAIPLAGLMTTVIGLIFGIPAARLKGLYLAIATLASQFIIEDFVGRAEWFSGGPSGSLAETPTLFGFSFDTDQTYFYLVFFWLALSILAVVNLLRTRDGRALVAVRDHYLSAQIMGVNLAKYRVLSFGVSSFFAGLAGALFGHYLGFVSAEGFTILLSIQFLAMIIIGGLGSVTGAVMGTVFILMLPQAMEVAAGGAAGIFPVLERGVPYIKEMSVGLAIVLFLIFEPEGLIHRWRLIRASLKLFPFSH
ncbi:MAG: branched-chain amino acid ABC transporter permease [Rhodospirillales bacterium]